MKYDNWKNESRSAAGLFLDPQNPRIPPSPKALTQPELIEELVLHDDVYELAKQISANGFFPNEPLIAVKENSDMFVVEGNRRLAACKLLLNPDLAPAKFKTRFNTLSATFDHNNLSKIPTLIAPSRAATIPLIIARHTASQISKWQPAMQAHFYYSLIQGGLSIDEVAAQFHLTPSEIKNELISHNLYSMACRLELSPEASAVVRDPRKFKLTTLTRIFENPDARSFFGVEFDETGRVVGKIDANEFKKGFTKAVLDVANGAADSRKLNSPKEIKIYLNGFGTEKPDLKKKGVFDSTTFLAAQVQKPTSAKPKPKPNPPLIPRGLFPKTLVCNIQNQRVRKLFDELRKLPPGGFPNSCTFAFRCFLELSIFCFLEAKGEIAKMQSEEQAKIDKYNANLPANKNKRTLVAHWTPELSEMLKWICTTKHNLIPQGHITRALDQAIHDEKDLIALNLVVHNPAYPASETRLRESYSRLEEFLKIILA